MARESQMLSQCPGIELASASETSKPVRPRENPKPSQVLGFEEAGCYSRFPIHLATITLSAS
jgi:hypothetical protein